MTTKKTSTRKSAGSSAITLLTQDHKTVDALFRSFDKLVKQDGDDEEKGGVVQEICAALSVHAQIEEEIFYPEVRSAFEDDEDVASMLDEADVEHASIKSLVEQLEDAEPGDDLFDAKVTVLKEYVKHHVQEEEEEIFPKVKKAKELDLEELGQRLEARKEELEGVEGDAGEMDDEQEDDGDAGEASAPEKETVTRTSAQQKGRR